MLLRRVPKPGLAQEHKVVPEGSQHWLLRTPKDNSMPCCHSPGKSGTSLSLHVLGRVC